MKIKLSVNDVAAKQLESGIWMYAYDYDEVAVHTIAGAAFELYVKRLNLSSFESDLMQESDGRTLQDFYKKWNLPYNFFKHGEHGRKKIEAIEYESTSAEYLLYFAAEANLAGPAEYRLSSAEVYKFFFILAHPHMFTTNLYERIKALSPKLAEIPFETMNSLETLKVWLDSKGHTFLNGTNSPYTKMPGEK